MGAGGSAAQSASCSVLPELSDLTPSPPSVLCSRPSHPCSFPAPWQGTLVQPSIFNGFSSLLPVFHLGLSLPITLPGFPFPACLGSPWHRPGCSWCLPHPHSHPPPASSLFSSSLWGAWSNKPCHPSPFCLHLPPAVPVQWIYL